ncbi:hypothetical protein K402DRAFT_462103 [Aulographum hederae CBS 113979]|uniref:Polynucleotide 5'-hydroxyl-kinase GRC3 n=1 Tax=Aulographum hederae CBS 113979 TaxID=1176131 RepID=A0A6G1H5H6_9PEZI|nr:hypothetical protein K402DRAFT_462103 [Aulographum hederae CBS 113979]
MSSGYGTSDAGAMAPVSAFAARTKQQAVDLEPLEDTESNPPDDLESVQYGDTDEFDEGMESEQEEETAIAIETDHLRKHVFSTWVPTSENLLDCEPDYVSIRLEHHEVVTFFGIYDISVRRGVISVYGAVLRPEQRSHRIYAPYTHALPALKCISRESAEITVRQLDQRKAEESETQHLSSLEPFSPLLGGLWNDQLDEEDENLQPPNGNHVQGINNYRSFRYIRNNHKDPLQRIFAPLRTSSWEDAIDKIVASGNSPITLICGPQNCGKNTFARVLTNVLLSKRSTRTASVDSNVVLYLDLDPSLPEYTPHGQISLMMLKDFNLGPSYCHPAMASDGSPNTLIRAHTVELDCHFNDVEHYEACAVNLLQTYHKMISSKWPEGVKKPSSFPLIINCPSSQIGSRNDATMILVEKLKTTHIVSLRKMSESHPSESSLDLFLKSFADKTPSVALLEVPFQPFIHRKIRTIPELRDVAMLSYFHSRQLPDGSFAWNTTPVTATKPYLLPYASEAEGAAFKGVAVLGDPFNMALLPLLLDVSLVSFVVIEDESLAKSIHVTTDPYHNVTFIASNNNYSTAADGTTVMPFDPSISRTVCIGFIRAIDKRNKQFHVLIPHFSVTELKYILPKENTFLVYGALKTPNWAILEDANAQKFFEKKLEDAKTREEFGGSSVVPLEERFVDDVVMLKNMLPKYPAATSTPYLDREMSDAFSFVPGAESEGVGGGEGEVQGSFEGGYESEDSIVKFMMDEEDVGKGSRDGKRKYEYEDGVGEGSRRRIEE